MTEPNIIVEQLRVIYNQGKSNEVRSLDGASVKIFPEEYVIIFGPSGCGKSTLLYGISGLQAPTYGEVVVNGKNLAKMTKREAVEFHQSGIGMIFQAFYLIPTLTVWDNVCLPKVFSGEDLKQRKIEAMKLLHRFGIAEQADKFPSQLSGGQKQRVAIARSLVNNPQIILADEPVGNLDSESAQNVLEILQELNTVDKKTVIMVTHNPEHLFYADRVIHMRDGKIVSEEIRREKRPVNEVKKEILNTPAEVSEDLRILSRTFKNLSLQQIGVLLVPFKAKQLLSHVLSELNEEQVSVAEALLKELLFKNINLEIFENRLDDDYNDGGAGFNKKRAKSFTARVEGILKQAENIGKNDPESIAILIDHLKKMFDLKLNEEQIKRLHIFLQLRVNNKIDRFGLVQRLDASMNLGGIGLYKNTAERLAREVEMIMLLKYSS